MVLVIAACGSPSDTAPTVSSVALPGVAAAIGESPARAEAGAINPRLLRRFKPVRATIALADVPAATPAQTALGRMMFFDKRLSAARDVSCNTCHRLDHDGVDGEPTSIGEHGARGRRNAPSVYHAAGHFTSFWDGRAASVEDQAVIVGWLGCLTGELPVAYIEPPTLPE